MVEAMLLVHTVNARILLVNPLQSSGVLSRGSLLSFCAFKGGMLGAPIAVREVDQQYPPVYTTELENPDVGLA